MTPTPAGLRSRPLHLRIALLVALVTSLLAGGPIPSVFGQATESVVIGGSLEPSRLEIAAGTTVTWRNEDAERHRVRSQAGPVAFDSGNLEPGASFDFTFDVAGTYAYLDERDDENAAWFGTIVVVPATQGSPTAGATPLLLPQSGEISIVDRAFSPVALQVASGATVTWTNADTEGHTVTAVDGAFDSGIMAEGATFSATLDTPGTYAYFCAIHPEMRGTVSVLDPAHATPAGPTEPAAQAEPSAAAGAEVTLIDRSFQPASVEVIAGGTVSWTNADTEGHTVTAVDGAFDSGIMAEGATFSATLDTPGAYDYFCAIPPEMRGSLTVAEPTGASAGGG